MKARATVKAREGASGRGCDSHEPVPVLDAIGHPLLGIGGVDVLPLLILDIRQQRVLGRVIVDGTVEREAVR